MRAALLGPNPGGVLQLSTQLALAAIVEWIRTNQ